MIQPLGGAQFLRRRHGLDYPQFFDFHHGKRLYSSEREIVKIDERRGGREERFLSTQADRFAGAKREEKIGLLRSK